MEYDLPKDLDTAPVNKVVVANLTNGMISVHLDNGVGPGIGAEMTKEQAQDFLKNLSDAIDASSATE